MNMHNDVFTKGHLNQTFGRLLLIVFGLFSFNVAHAQAPGGVTNNLSLWFKADTNVYNNAGATVLAANGDIVQVWQEETGNTFIPNINLSSGTGNPSFDSNSMNFNPSVDFDGNDALRNNLSHQYQNIFNTAQSNTVILVQNISSGIVSAMWSEPVQNTKVAFELTTTDYKHGSFGSTISGGVNLANTPAIVIGSSNGTTNTQSIDINGDFKGSNSFNPIPITTSGRLALGAAAGALNFAATTDITEFIVYAGIPSATEEQEIESYLALKYGITLDQGVAQSYLNSSGLEVYDANGVFNAYDNNIIGLAQDNASTLDQRVSRSVNAGSILTIANDQDFSSSNIDGTRTSLGDGNYWVTGHNGAGSGFNSIYDTQANFRMDRIWAVDVTGSPGSVYVAIPNTISFPAGTPSVIVSSDTSFDASDTVVALTDDGTHFWAQISPADGAFFTFAGATPTAVQLGDVSLDFFSLDAMFANNVSTASLRALLQSFSDSGFTNNDSISKMTGNALEQALRRHLDADGDGFVGRISWKTLSQSGTLGFYVEREDAEGNWFRVHAQLLPAVIPAPFGAEYSLFDNGALRGQNVRYRLVELETNGLEKTYGPFESR